jgi:hypothetical protein
MAYGTPPFKSPAMGPQVQGLMPITKTGVSLAGAQVADSPLYAAAMLLGAGIGGALIGWVAAGSRDGAVKGAAFAAGMTGLSSGVATWSTDKILGATLVAAGGAGMGWSIKDRIKRRR